LRPFEKPKIPSNEQMAFQFIERAPRVETESSLIHIMITAKPFSDIGWDR
jgi:hypothetical protein